MAYRRPRQPRKARYQVRALPPIMPIAAALAILAAIVLGVNFVAKGGASGGHPTVNEHWHALYDLVLCGERIPKYPASPNLGVHTHGDGIIHSHPGQPDQAGKNANLKRFFTSLGAELRQGFLRLPDGRQLKDGDACPDGKTGTVKLIVNGLENPDFEAYVPQEGDLVKVEFR